MKAKGRHPEKALSALQVKQAKTPGMFADGNGLYLVVDPSGARRWILRIVVQGRRRDIGLGSATLVPLAEAREAALAFRKVARQGGDPLADRAKARNVVPTFEAAARAVHDQHKDTWKNEKHGQQWLNTLEQYAFPIIGQKPVNLIETPEVLKVLSPIWLIKPETARRVRQRIGTVMDWAKTAGHRSGENPINGISRGLPKQTDKDKHFVALPYGEVPAFVRQLNAEGTPSPAKLAFEFLILTASRTSEVLHACWSEFDLTQKLWTIPASRMKAGKEHRVPLAERAIALLDVARAMSPGSELLFPSKVETKALSNMVFLAMIRRMKVDTTAHGFRSAFRDWAAETTSFPREVVEMALAHTIESKVEAAYRRGDLLEKRRALMETWAMFVMPQVPKE